MSSVTRHFILSSMAVVAMHTAVLAQTLPTAPDNGDRWNAMDASNSRLPVLGSDRPDFDAFAPTTVDQSTDRAYRAQSVTIASLTADAAWSAAQISRANTFPGGVAALDALGGAIHNLDTNPEGKAEVLARIAETHLRVIGDTNGAALLAAGARIAARGEAKMAVSYMRGMAQDLRKVGAIAAAQYLENAATLAQDGMGDPRSGVLDAATLAMRFGATPQPDVARILAYDPATLTNEQVRDLVIALIMRIGAAITDPAYQELAQKLERNANPEGIAYIQGRINAAQSEAATAARVRNGAAAPSINTNTSPFQNRN